MARYRLTMLGVGLVATVALAGCQAKTVSGSGGLSGGAPTTASSPAGTSAPVPASAAPSTGTTPSTAPPAGGSAGGSTPKSGSTPTSGAFAAQVAAAKTQWKSGATADSADQGMYWIKAATDLAGAGTAYLKQVEELTELATLPDAQQSTEQNTEYHKDINALNSFFGTPGLYS